MEDLLRRRRYHEGEAKRLRELAQDATRQAEEHEESCRAYDRVLRDLPEAADTESPGDPVESPGSTATGEENGDGASEALIDLVRVAVAQQRGRFKVEDVRQALEVMAPEVLTSLRPRSLTKALWRLAQIKEIKQVRPGHGPRPAIYVKKAPREEKE